MNTNISANNTAIADAENKSNISSSKKKSDISPKHLFSSIKSTLITVLSFILILLFINTYFVSVTQISGESMYPTFTTGDFVMFSRISVWQPRDYKQGDVVVCRFGIKEYNEENNTYISNNTATYIKRIVAIEGDTIEISNGRVLVNEIDITDKYWPDTVVKNTLIRLKVPQGHVFVIGDNINDSIDSRVVNCLPYSNLLGKVVLKMQFKGIFSEKSPIKFPSFEKI